MTTKKIIISILALTVISAGGYFTVKQIQKQRTFDPQVEYNEVMNQCNEIIAEAAANCPAEGYSSYLFKAKYSLEIPGMQEVNEDRTMHGGPCPYEIAGKTEETAIYSENRIYDRSFKAEEISKYAKGRCSASCNSSNCPQFTQSEKIRKGCLYPIYHYVDGPDDEEQMELVKEYCQLRAKRRVVNENGDVSEETWRQCDVEPDSCDFVKVRVEGGESKWIASCCCSCDKVQITYPSSGRVWINGQWIQTTRENMFSIDLPPILEITESTIEVTEGEKIIVLAKAVDPEYKTTGLTYGWPLNENGIWQTTIGDAGSYNAEITASDGANTTKRTVKITVNKQGQSDEEDAVEDAAEDRDGEDEKPDTQEAIITINDFSLTTACGGSINLQGNTSGDYDKIAGITLLLNLSSTDIPLPVDYQLTTGDFLLNPAALIPGIYNYSLIVDLPNGQINNAPSGMFEIKACDVEGCTDAEAQNYNAQATVDDGSCTYPPSEQNPPADPPEPIAKDISAVNVGALVKCEDDFIWVEVDGNLTGADVGMVNNVYVLINGAGITTGYHPTDNYWFIGSQYDMENISYSYQIQISLSDETTQIIKQGTTTSHCD